MDPSGYATTSFWLESAGDDLTPRPALHGAIDVDVAILGAGYTGLWTARTLLRHDPSLKVVLVEREIAGFGASGRNGGWVASGLNASSDRLARQFGAAGMNAIEDAVAGAVDEVGRAIQEEGIEADYAKGGSLTVARGPEQLPALEAHWRSLERSGRAVGYRRLDAAETAGRIRIEGALGSVYGSQYAVVHPGKLVRGLARAVERQGATIFERTAVTDVEPGGLPGLRPALRTTGGLVRAGAVVLAGEAYLSQLRRYHRALLPLYSLIVLTEPISEGDWATIGWRAREVVSSYRLSVDYLSRTADGRILFGGRGAPYRFGSAIEPAFDRDGRTHALLRQMVEAWFPSLRGIAFGHAWGGPLGMPRDWIPTFSFDPRTGIASGRGYTGHGVATANLAGRVLADLILGRQTELSDLPLVNHRSPNWEPEPLRWIGVRFTQESLLRLDARTARTGRPPSGRSLAERIADH
ncbi:MAG: NAD(P)/FAD-dependent oxidoreductase [Candidatus Limnocylindrales bacterium]